MSDPTPVPVPVTKTTLVHTLLADLKAVPALYSSFVTSITTNVPLVGPLAGLEVYRQDLIAAYTVFTKIETFITAMNTLPKT